MFPKLHFSYLLYTHLGDSSKENRFNLISLQWNIILSGNVIKKKTYIVNYIRLHSISSETQFHEINLIFFKLVRIHSNNNMCFFLLS